LTHEVAVVDLNDENETSRVVHSGIELIGGFRPTENSRIAIKPNLCSARRPPESGATTRVSVVDAIIDYVNAQTKNCSILIIESDSDRTADEAFRLLGYDELEKTHDNVKLINLSKDKFVKILPSKVNKLIAMEIPETLLSVDHLISVANLKRHVHERMTGVWKNVWGLLSSKPVRMRLHPFLSEALFDVNSILWPDLCVIDGYIGLEGPGPIEGSPKRVGKMLFSKDPLAIDVVATKIMGESAKRVPHLNYALKKLHRKLEDVICVGSEISNVDFKFITGTQYWLYRASLRLRKWSEYMENLGYIFAILSYASRSQGLREMAGGKIFSISKSLSIAKNLVFKVEAAERTFG
jgi:uncharacterized protein (DUF362 family)